MGIRVKARYENKVLKPLEGLDLKEGEDVEIILRPHRSDLEEKVRELDEYLSTNTPKPFVSELERGYKWFTEEYSLRKLEFLAFLVIWVLPKQITQTFKYTL